MAIFGYGAVSSVVNLLTTELNTITTATGSAYSPEINNTTGSQMAILWLTIASNSLAFTSGSLASIYIVPSTTPGAASGAYPTYTAGSGYKLALGNYWAADIWINPATQSANVVNETKAGIYIPPGYFKAILANETGVTWPASGNTLKLYYTPTQVT